MVATEKKGKNMTSTFIVTKISNLPWRGRYAREITFDLQDGVSTFEPVPGGRPRLTNRWPLEDVIDLVEQDEQVLALLLRKGRGGSAEELKFSVANEVLRAQLCRTLTQLLSDFQDARKQGAQQRQQESPALPLVVATVARASAESERDHRERLVAATAVAEAREAWEKETIARLEEERARSRAELQAALEESARAHSQWRAEIVGNSHAELREALEVAARAHSQWRAETQLALTELENREKVATRDAAETRLRMADMEAAAAAGKANRRLAMRRLAEIEAEAAKELKAEREAAAQELAAAHRAAEVAEADAKALEAAVEAAVAHSDAEVEAREAAVARVIELSRALAESSLAGEARLSYAASLVGERSRRAREQATLRACLHAMQQHALHWQHRKALASAARNLHECNHGQQQPWWEALLGLTVQPQPQPQPQPLPLQQADSASAPQLALAISPSLDSDDTADESPSGTTRVVRSAATCDEAATGSVARPATPDRPPSTPLTEQTVRELAAAVQAQATVVHAVQAHMLRRGGNLATNRISPLRRRLGERLDIQKYTQSGLAVGVYMGFGGGEVNSPGGRPSAAQPSDTPTANGGGGSAANGAVGEMAGGAVGGAAGSDVGALLADSLAMLSEMQEALRVRAEAIVLGGAEGGGHEPILLDDGEEEEEEEEEGGEEQCESTDGRVDDGARVNAKGGIVETGAGLGVEQTKRRLQDRGGLDRTGCDDTDDEEEEENEQELEGESAGMPAYEEYMPVSTETLEGIAAARERAASDQTSEIDRRRGREISL